jgi:MarR family transcriptional regulator, organic hydroperoxide resistance regulator
VTRPSSLLQREIRQSKPFVSRRQEAVLGLFKTADLIRRLIDGFLEPYGVTPQQYNVLRILRGAGDDGIATLAIGGRMIEQTPGVTRLLGRLEKKGWVRRRRQTGDRRQVLCWITPAGRKLLAKLDRPMQELGGFRRQCLRRPGTAGLDRFARQDSRRTRRFGK